MQTQCLAALPLTPKREGKVGRMEGHSSSPLGPWSRALQSQWKKTSLDLNGFWSWSGEGQACYSEQKMGEKLHNYLCHQRLGIHVPYLGGRNYGILSSSWSAALCHLSLRLCVLTCTVWSHKARSLASVNQSNSVEESGPYTATIHLCLKALCRMAKSIATLLAEIDFKSLERLSRREVEERRMTCVPVNHLATVPWMLCKWRSHTVWRWQCSLSVLSVSFH